MLSEPSPFATPLKICTWNAAGIKRKRNEVQVFFNTHDVSIFMVGETFLKPGDSFNLRGFRCFRKDRPAKVGGGVAVFFRSSISATQIQL